MNIFLIKTTLQIFSIKNILFMDATVRTSSQLKSVLRRLRRERGLSQAAFGQSVGLSQERISTIENHPERVTVDQILTLIMALGAELIVRPRAHHGPETPDTPEPTENW
ncbi:MAG: helix-turn-helix domain-containing protein [Zoogloeaceae bacterium]|nr:helix-turn-helix domain-containing protein [Zoogloeaceae bacterium]